MTEETRTRSEKYPKRLWLAGPAPYVAQETVLMGDGITFVKFENGAALVHSAEQEATVRKALAGRVFDEDLKEAEVYPQTGWATLSQKAYNAHTKLAGQ